MPRHAHLGGTYRLPVSAFSKFLVPAYGAVWVRGANVHFTTFSSGWDCHVICLVALRYQEMGG